MLVAQEIVDEVELMLELAVLLQNGKQLASLAMPAVCGAPTQQYGLLLSSPRTAPGQQ